MEFEIDDCDVLFDVSTNPSLIDRLRPPRSRQTKLASWNRKPCQKAVVIPEEDDQLA